MKKRFLSVFLALALCLTLLPTAAVALDDDGEVTVLTSTNIVAEGDNKGCLILTPGKSYKLGGDVSASVVIRGEGSETAVLDLDGYVLSSDLSYTNIIGVAAGKALIVKDSNSGKRTHKFTPDSNGCWILDNTEGTKTVTGGVIYGAGTKQGVLIDGQASFTLESGSIVGCAPSSRGGGVHVQDGESAASHGSFTMTGGSIRGCVASSGDGGGVYVGEYGHFTMTGGCITDCTARKGDSFGGGVFASVDAVFTMSGGEILDCHAGCGGCALSGNQNTKFILAGGKIGACTKSGCTSKSGVDVSDRGTIVYAHGGTVEASVLVNVLEWDNSTFGKITFDPTVQGYTEGKTTAFIGNVTNNGTISSGIYYGGLVNSGGTISGKTITFKNDTSVYATEVVGDGQKSIAPIAPTPSEEYLAFDGWYTNNSTKYSFGGTLSENITLSARFKPKPATCTAPTTNALTYNGTEQTLVTAGTVEYGTMMYCLTEDGIYEADIPTAKDAGTYTVYYYAKGTDGYGDSAVSNAPVTIAAKEVTVSGITAEGKTYDGGTAATLKYDDATISGTFDGDTLTVSATGTFTDKNVGEDKTVSISGLTLGGADAGNYKLASSGQQTEAAAAIAPREVGLSWTNTSLSYNGQPQKPTATATSTVNGDTVTVTVTGGQTNAGTGYTATADNLSNGNYMLPEDRTTSFSIGEAALTDVSVTQHGTLIYNGGPQTAAVTTKGTTVDDSEISFTYSTVADGTYSTFVPSLISGTHTVYYKASAANHATATGSFKITIGKTTVTVTAEDKSAYTYHSAPNLSSPVLGTDYTLSGLADGDTLDSSVTIALTCDADMNKTGDYDIVPSVTGEDSRYEFVCVNGKLTVSDRPSSPAPTYSITASTTTNGTVKVSPRYAERGDSVTITVAPDKGFTLETLTVLDKNGKEIELTDKGDGKYTFKMPASKVTVKAAFAEDNSMLNFFVDVPVDAYYYDAVLWAAENGITGGVDAVHFAPNATCTRAQIVTFLWRAAGSPEPKAVSSFTDVSADAYYAKAVAWAVENGITGGIGGNKFAPDATCTRAQAMTFLYRAAGSPAVSGDIAFSDVGTDAYYANAVAWAAKEGITGGIGGGLFGSDNDCTRAQIVTFLYRSIVK